MWSLSRRSLGQHRLSRNCGPRPVELAKGTGGRLLAMLGEQWTGASQIWWGEGESCKSPGRKQFLSCSGGGKRQDLNYTTTEMCCLRSVLGLTADAPSWRCLLHLLGAPGPRAPTFPVAPQPPWASGSALLSQKGISFFQIRQPGPKELFSSIVQAWQIINFWLICLELWAPQHSFRRWTAV